MTWLGEGFIVDIREATTRGIWKCLEQRTKKESKLNMANRQDLTMKEAGSERTRERDEERQ